MNPNFSINNTFGIYDSTWNCTGGIRQPSKTTTTTNSGGRNENISIMCITKMETGDYIEVHCANITNTNNITVTDLNFIVTQL